MGLNQTLFLHRPLYLSGIWHNCLESQHQREDEIELCHYNKNMILGFGINIIERAYVTT